MTGLPVQVLSSVVGHATHSAMRGHHAGSGRSRQMAHAVIAMGITHHRSAGRTVNGTNSQRATGGYSTSPAVMGYGPASWYGSKYGPPASQRAAASRYSRKSTPNGCSSGWGTSSAM